VGIQADDQKVFIDFSDTSSCFRSTFLLGAQRQTNFELLGCRLYASDPSGGVLSGMPLSIEYRPGRSAHHAVLRRDANMVGSHANSAMTSVFSLWSLAIHHLLLSGC
jgi:hypothetical protein